MGHGRPPGLRTKPNLAEKLQMWGCSWWWRGCAGAACAWARGSILGGKADEGEVWDEPYDNCAACFRPVGYRD